MKDLKARYWLMYLWWHICVKWILKNVAKATNNHPLVLYPLMIDMEFSMMYYYFKYGFGTTYNRVYNYSKVIVKELSGKNDDDKEDLSLEFLTEKVKFRIELNREMNELSSQNGYIQFDDSKRGYKVVYD